ncbi:hypothetical protein ACQ4PT_006464 [Festuca glaucescens]
MAAKGGRSGLGAKGDDSAALERALKNLELREGELDDVIIGKKDLEVLHKRSRWMALARVNTRKACSTDALFQTLRYIWGLAIDPELREVDDNLFTFKFFCLGDWNKVMLQGPWLFRKLVVVISEYDGKGNPRSAPLERIEVWSQIHAIPELYREVEIVDQLARRIGKVKSIEMTHQRWFEGDYVRVRASINVSDPLIRFTPLNIEGEGRQMLQVKYEKIGYFCNVCGVMGHDMEECGDGVHKEEDVQYGNWMYAQRRAQINSLPSFRASFAIRGRCRGRGGRGEWNAERKRSSEDAFEDDEVKDTASSPLKTGTGAAMEEDNVLAMGVRKDPMQRLNFDEIPGEEGAPGTVEAGTDGKGTTAPPMHPPYIGPREKKRTKKGDGSTNSASSSDTNPMATSAAPFEEDRRAQ